MKWCRFLNFQFMMEHLVAGMTCSTTTATTSLMRRLSSSQAEESLSIYSTYLVRSFQLPSCLPDVISIEQNFCFSSLLQNSGFQVMATPMGQMLAPMLQQMNPTGTSIPFAQVMPTPQQSLVNFNHSNSGSSFSCILTAFKTSPCCKTLPSVRLHHLRRAPQGGRACQEVGRVQCSSGGRYKA